MALKNTNKSFGYIKESVFNTTPAAQKNLTRFADESLTYDKSIIKVKEQSSDRQNRDQIDGQAKTSGAVNCPLIYANTDEFIAGAMYSAWSTAVNVSATDISFANADNSINSTVTDFTAQNLSVGQWIKISGDSVTGNNGFWKIVSIATNKVVLSGGTITDDVAGDTIVIKGSMVRNGITQSSYSLEVNYSDAATFLQYTGMVPNSMDLNFELGKEATINFGFQGCGHTLSGTSFGTGADVAATNNDVIGKLTSVEVLNEAGTSVIGYATKFAVKVSNNVKEQNVLGVANTVGISYGMFDVSGELEMYWNDSTQYNKWVNQTATDLVLRVTDNGTHYYIITIPRVKISKAAIKENNNALFNPMSFNALRDSTLGITLQVDKF